VKFFPFCQVSKGQDEILNLSTILNFIGEVNICQNYIGQGASRYKFDISFAVVYESNRISIVLKHAFTPPFFC
jgi:hypothetical protein